jgi:aryl-alcohol dehydrogenase-like predicted oxidoreductase
MKYRKLGRTHLDVSEIGFGAWAIGGSWGPQAKSDSIDALHQAIDSGVNLIDTAAGYGNGKSERIIAEVLKERKEDIIVATKTPPDKGPWPPTPYCNTEDRYSEDYLRKNVEQRMKNLNTDSIDVLQLHTWTRAWNKNPKPLDHLKKLQAEGKIGHIGISTPEHDQNCVIELMRKGYLDVIQVIYNIFEQEPAAELLTVARENNVGVIVRVAFDEGVLTGKYTTDSTFPEGDFRRNYFAGDRLARAVERVEAIKKDIQDTDYTMPQVALLFCLAHPAVSTVIPGMRNVQQAKANTGVSELPPLSDELLNRLKKHAWRKSFWYAGK